MLRLVIAGPFGNYLSPNTRFFSEASTYAHCLITYYCDPVQVTGIWQKARARLIIDHHFCPSVLIWQLSQPSNLSNQNSDTINIFLAFPSLEFLSIWWKHLPTVKWAKLCQRIKQSKGFILHPMLTLKCQENCLSRGAIFWWKCSRKMYICRLKL